VELSNDAGAHIGGVTSYFAPLSRILLGLISDNHRGLDARLVAWRMDHALLIFDLIEDRLWSRQV